MGKRKGKFWRLAKDNAFIGGGVAVAIAAYGFLIAGAVKFSILLLVIAWAIMTYAICKHNFFPDKPYLNQVVGNVGVSVILAGILALSWVLLHPDAKPEPQELISQTTEKSPEPTNTVPDPTPDPTVESDFRIVREWIALSPYKSKDGELLTTVTVMLSITNLGLPTAIPDWLIAVRMPHLERPFGYEPIALRGTFTLSADGQDDTILYDKDILYKKTLDPIKNGGFVRGWLHFRIRRDFSIVNVPGTVLEVWCTDVRNKMYQIVVQDRFPLEHTGYIIRPLPGVEIAKKPVKPVKKRKRN